MKNEATILMDDFVFEVTQDVKAVDECQKLEFFFWLLSGFLATLDHRRIEDVTTVCSRNYCLIIKLSMNNSSELFSLTQICTGIIRKNLVNDCFSQWVRTFKYNMNKKKSHGAQFEKIKLQVSISKLLSSPWYQMKGENFDSFSGFSLKISFVFFLLYKPVLVCIT